MSVIPESWRGTEENPKIKANLGYRRPCLKKSKQEKKSQAMPYTVLFLIQTGIVLSRDKTCPKDVFIT